MAKDSDGVKPYPGEYALTYGPDATLLERNGKLLAAEPI